MVGVVVELVDGGLVVGALVGGEAGAVTEPEAPVVVSLPAVGAGAVVVEALAAAPVEAMAEPDHQSLEARTRGEAFR